MESGFTTRPFGTTGLSVGALGLGSSFGLPAKEVERAFDRGVNFFLWGSLRKNDFGVGLRNLAPQHREDMVVAIQSYTRFASLMEWSVNRALRFMKTDYVDVLCLAWWNGPPPPRIIDAALALREKGKIRSVVVSCHHQRGRRSVGTKMFLDDCRVRRVLSSACPSDPACSAYSIADNP